MKTRTIKMIGLMALTMITLSSCTKEDLTGTGAYVDLGLPSGTLWRDMNESDGDVTLFTFHEAVSKFGSNLPTKDQYEELISSCTWKNEKRYYKVIGPNGNYIVMPTTSKIDCQGTVLERDITGDYWSSASYYSEVTGLNLAWALHFTCGNNNVASSIIMWSFTDCLKHTVRLVQNQ